MRVLTQFENNVVAAGCDVCGAKEEISTSIVAGTVVGLATGAGMAMAGFGSGYIIIAGAVLGSAAGISTPWILANTSVKVVQPT